MPVVVQFCAVLLFIIIIIIIIIAEWVGMCIMKGMV